MSMNTGSASKLLAPGLRNVMFRGYQEREREYEKIFNLQTSKRNYEEDLEFIGLGVMGTKPEGSPITYTDATQGGVKRYTHVPFGAGYRVTKEAQDDDLYGVVNAKKMSRELGKGARVAREQYAANVLNNGFSIADGFPKSGSTQTLFHASHTLSGGGGTYSNLGAADLSQSALEAAIISFHKLVDENGVPIVVSPETLLVPPDLIMLARELLGSEYKPYTANNEVNPTRADKLSLQVNHYITDSDSWFVLAAKGDHNLNFFVRNDLSFEYADDFDTGDMKVKGYQRFSVGYGDWRGVWGSPGA